MKYQDHIDFMFFHKSNILYFCNAGKDRTGVVSAILLLKLGFDVDYIVRDYMKSKDNLMDMLTSFVRKNPDIDINIITPHERYIREFIDVYTKENRKK